MSVIASCSITVSIERIVESTHRFYKLQSSTAAAPAKPTSIDTLPPTGWTDVEPAYTEGSTNSLYTVDLTVFSDGTFSYTDVSLSSSYEAAKSAYNKAQAAQDTAEGVEESLKHITGINLSPFFSHDLADKYDASTNPDGYWAGVTEGSRITYEPLGDGWLRIRINNASGTGTFNANLIIVNDDIIEYGEDYTFLFEFKNRVSVTDGAGVFYMVQVDNEQFWGNSIKKLLEGTGSNTTVNWTSVPTDGTVYRKRFVKKSEAADSSHITSALSRMVYLRARASAGEDVACDIRISMYRGEYMGPYVPFNLVDADYVRTLAETAAEAAERIKIYSIEPSVSRIKKDWYDGTLDPTTIRFEAYCNGGSYTGGHMYVESRSGDTWTSVIDGTGGAIVHTVRADAEEIRCRLTTRDAEPVELASLLIPVIIDMSQVTQKQIFNKLTNDGAVQGLIMHNGQCYINAAYLNIGYGTNIYENYDTLLNITNDTLYWKKSSDVSGVGVIDSDSGVSGCKAFYISTTTGNNGYIFLGNSSNRKGAIKVNVGQKYRISFYAKANNSSGKIRPWVVLFSDYGDTQSGQTGLTTFNLTTSFARYEATYTATSPYIGLGFANVTTYARVEVSAIMIEAVDSDDDPTSPFMPAGSTQIDGGMIKTHSIDANAIKAKSLTSDQIDVVGGWHINADSIQSNGTWSMPGESETHPKIEMLKNGELKIGDVTLDNNYGALRIQYGLELYTTRDPEILSDGSGQFRIYNIRGGSGITGQALGITSSDVVGVLSASSRRYKDPCGFTSQDEAEKLLSLPVIRFKYKDGYLMKGDQMEGKEMPGFYAEDVAEILPEAAIYDEKGRPEDWNHRILIPAMLKLIQSQHDRIQNLEERISRLEKLLIKESD